MAQSAGNINAPLPSNVAMQANAKAAADFLTRFDPEGWHSITCIGNAGVTGRIFKPGKDQNERMRKYIAANMCDHDMYFSPAEPALDAQGPKLAKEDIARIRTLHVDIDPRANADLASEAARLAKIGAAFKDEIELGEVGAPGFVIASGNGLQAFFPLKEKLDASPENVAQVERLNIALLEKFGGDKGTHNVDRIMRLPFTVNFQRGKKKAGRPKVATALVAEDMACRTTIKEAFEQFGSPARATPSANDNRPERAPPSAGSHSGWEKIAEKIAQRGAFDHDTLDDLPNLKAKFEAACASNRKLATLVDDGAAALPELKDVSGYFTKVDDDGNDTGELIGGDTHDQSRSGYRAHVAGHLAKAGFKPVEYAAIMWTLPDGGLREIASEKGEYKARREAARDWTYVWNREQAKPKEADADTPAKPNEPKRKLAFTLFEDAVREASNEDTRQLIADLLDFEAMSVMYGESNAGKSFLALLIAFHIAAGLPFTDKATEQGLVVYIVAEGGRRFNRRLAALKTKYTPEGSLPIAVVKSSVDLHGNESDAREIIKLIADAEQATGCKAMLVIVDTLSRVLGDGDENAGRDMNQVVRNVDLIRAKSGAHVMVIHHSGKDKARGARGWSGLRAATDTEIEVVKEASGLRVAEVTKQRDMETGYNVAFSINDVEIGEPRVDGKPNKAGVAEIVAAKAETRRRSEAPKGAKLTDGEQDVLNHIIMLASAQAAKEGVSEYVATVALADVLAAINDDKKAIAGEGATEMKDNYLRKVRSKLVEKGVIVEAGERGCVMLKPPPGSGEAFGAVDEDE